MPHGAAKPRPQDDEAIGRMCRYLKKHGLVGQTTLAGKLTLTPIEDLIYEQQWVRSPERTKESL